MLEHRRNGWYLLGGSMIAGGVAWLAAWGVAVASAGPPNSLQFWSAASFGATGIVIVGSLLVLAIMYDWLTLPKRLYPGKNDLPLKVASGEPHYHDWNYAASVVAFPIMITNKTSAPLTLPGGCRIKGNMGNIPSWREKLGEGETGSFLREVESQKRTDHHQPNIAHRAIIPARASLEFWYVTDVSRHQRGVYLDMTVYFNDGDGNEYSAKFERIPKQQILSKRPLSL